MSISRKKSNNKNISYGLNLSNRRNEQVKCCRGFSLIELAAVITIIGFLIAVIVTSNSLINAAKIHAVVFDFERYKESIVAFNKIYKSLPGDIPDAYDYWNNDCAASAVQCNGNDDEVISAVTNGNVVEQYMAWKHLSLSKLIYDRIYTGVDTSGIVIGETIPLSKYGDSSVGTPSRGGYWFVNSNNVYGKKGLVLGLGSVGSEVDRFGGAVMPRDAERIDAKIDDGKADSGNLYIARGIPSVTNRCTSKAATESAPSILLNNDKTKSCALYFWLPSLN